MKRATVQRLLRQIGAPASAISAIALTDPDGRPRIRVFFDPARVARARIPAQFEDCVVEAVPRSTAVGECGG